MRTNILVNPLTEMNPPGWELRVAELMENPDLKQQAKNAIEPTVQVIEDKTMLTALGIDEEESPLSGKPN